MKRTASLLMVALVSWFTASGQSAGTGRPALPSDIYAAAGQDSDSLLKNPAINTRMKKLLGNKYGSFMESFETLTPVTKEGDFLFSSGCLIHACTHLESAVAVDLVNRTVHAAIFRRGEKTRYFDEGGRATPVVVRGWANHLRRINEPTPDDAGARSEPSPPKRLRGPAAVRGFIGGE